MCRTSALILNQSSALYAILDIRREINRRQTAMKARVTQATFAAMRGALRSSVICCCSYKSFAGDGVTAAGWSIVQGVAEDVGECGSSTDFLQSYRRIEVLLEESSD